MPLTWTLRFVILRRPGFAKDADLSHVKAAVPQVFRDESRPFRALVPRDGNDADRPQGHPHRNQDDDEHDFAPKDGVLPVFGETEDESEEDRGEDCQRQEEDPDRPGDPEYGDARLEPRSGAPPKPQPQRGSGGDSKRNGEEHRRRNERNASLGGENANHNDKKETEGT